MAKDDYFNIDVAEWDRALIGFDTDRLRGSICLTSPTQLVAIERGRRSLARAYATRSRTWTDLFLFSAGRATRRDLTQIGGLPYRPAGEPWPKDSKGTELPFVAQIRFRESKDIMPNPCGDVLLIFGSPERLECEWTFEWFNFDIPASELVFEGQAGPLLQGFQGSFGHRCRYSDYPYDPSSDDGDLDLLPATKVGGLPVCFPERRPCCEGYFATLASCQPPYRSPFPWINHPDPIVMQSAHAPEDTFSVFDMWVANLCFNLDGSIRVELDKI